MCLISFTLQVATDGALLVHVREPSEAGSDNALPIPSDLLSWAANPPPPPPATTPPPPPSPSQNSEPFSTSEMDCDNTEMDDQSVNLLTENGMDLPQEDQGSSPGREPVLLVTEPPQLPPGQISAPPMITKPAVQPLASTHKDGVASITLSAVSPDGNAAVVLCSGVAAQEGPYDGEPMEDPAAAGSHHVKEKKKKKEKVSDTHTTSILINLLIVIVIRVSAIISRNSAWPLVKLLEHPDIQIFSNLKLKPMW